MKKVKYVSMQKDVFTKQLGGYSHFKGVALALSQLYSVTLVGFNLKNMNIRHLALKEITPNIYYLKILCDYLADFESDVYIIRKTLTGSLLLTLFYPLKCILLRVMKKKQLLIYEYNGISGEFNEKIPKPLKAMFKIVNIIPTIFSDFTYCVNDSIREKLKIYSNIDKLFVCEN